MSFKFLYICISWLLALNSVVKAVQVDYYHGKNHSQTEVQPFSEPILAWTLQIQPGTTEKLLKLTENFPLSVFPIHLSPDHFILLFDDKKQSTSNQTLLSAMISALKPSENFHVFYESRKLVESALDQEPWVVWYSIEVIKKRKRRRPTFTNLGANVSSQIHDPEFPNQWHLYNDLYPRHDTNALAAWLMGYKGAEVTVGLIDDGLEYTHPDLKDAYCAEGSYDFNDDDAYPLPSESSDSDYHGTRCAGEISSQPNSICGVGIAFEAKISGLKVLGGPVTDTIEALALNYAWNINHIYSCSWGPLDNGFSIDGPHKLGGLAFSKGVEFGRQGLGSIFVVASGNGGPMDDCNYDGYSNSMYTITIGAVDEMHSQMPYVEHCDPMLAVTYSNGMQRAIVTTDWTFANIEGCTRNHSGTSAAAPLASGMIAIALSARPCLTWRDIQHVIVLSARPLRRHSIYQENAAGLRHSGYHGFGLLDAWRVVKVSQILPHVAPLCMVASLKLDVDVDLQVNANSTVFYTISQKMLICESNRSLNSLEHVIVLFDLQHPHRGDLEFFLRCPSGTTTLLAHKRPYDRSSERFQWIFSTVACWGESPEGLWTFSILDTGGNSSFLGHLWSWRLVLSGSNTSSTEYTQTVKFVQSVLDGRTKAESILCPVEDVEIDVEIDFPFSQHLLLFLVFVFLSLLSFVGVIICIQQVNRRGYREHFEMRLFGGSQDRSPTREERSPLMHVTPSS